MGISLKYLLEIFSFTFIVLAAYFGKSTNYINLPHIRTTLVWLIVHRFLEAVYF